MSLFHVKNCSLILLLLKVGAFESIPFFGLLGGLLGGGVAPPQVNPMYQPNPASFAQQPIAQNPNQQQPVNPYQQQPASPYQQQPWSLMPQHPTIFSPYGGGVIPNLSGGIFNAINGLSYSTQSMIGGLLGGIANIFGGAFPPPQPYFPPPPPGPPPNGTNTGQGGDQAAANPNQGNADKPNGEDTQQE